MDCPSIRFAFVVCFIVLAACAVDTENDVPTEVVDAASNEAIFGDDDRRAMDDAFFKTNVQFRAVGRLEMGGRSCTATHFAPNYLITAQHCVKHAATQTGVLFRPAFVGPNTSENRAQRPSIRSRRIVVGTGVDAFHHRGADWAVVELDPSTYKRGTPNADSGIPSYPTSFEGWWTIPLISLTNPLPDEGVTVSHFGYSGDFAKEHQAGSYILQCVLREDALCSESGPHEAGILFSDCDRMAGSSGGPFVTGGLDDPRIVAIVKAGHDTTFENWSEAKANDEVSSNSFRHAPVNAAGFTATPTSKSTRLIGFSNNGGTRGLTPVSHVNLLSEDGYHAQDQWFDWSRVEPGSVLPTSFGRMTSTMTTDGRGWLFAIADGQVWHRFESSTGAWSGWQPWTLGTQPSSTSIVDIEAHAAGGAMHFYTLHNDGAVRMERKMNLLTSFARAPSTLGTIAGARALAATDIDGVHQVFAITNNAVHTTSETNLFGAKVWSRWSPTFGTGLPPSLELLDITVVHDNNKRVDIFLLVKSGGVDTRIYRRTKVDATRASAWSDWTLFDRSDVIEAATQIEGTTPSEATNYRPRLFVVRDAQVFTRGYNPYATWLPLYSPAIPKSCE